MIGFIVINFTIPHEHYLFEASYFLFSMFYVFCIIVRPPNRNRSFITLTGSRLVLVIFSLIDWIDLLFYRMSIVCIDHWFYEFFVRHAAPEEENVVLETLGNERS